MKNSLLTIAILFTVSWLTQAQNEQVIKDYLTQVEFGEYTFKKAETIKMSKEEDEFRANFKQEFLTFINTYGNSQGMEADFDMEDMTDSMIKDMYHEVFELDELSPEEVEEHANLAGIDHEHFIKMVDHCHRFINLKNDEAGSYQRTMWEVKTNNERVTLTFYIDDQGKVIDFQEDWPDF